MISRQKTHIYEKNLRDFLKFSFFFLTKPYCFLTYFTTFISENIFPHVVSVIFPTVVSSGLLYCHLIPVEHALVLAAKSCHTFNFLPVLSLIFPKHFLDLDPRNRLSYGSRSLTSCSEKVFLSLYIREKEGTLKTS